jgi:hypothetical protein
MTAERVVIEHAPCQPARFRNAAEHGRESTAALSSMASLLWTSRGHDVRADRRFAAHDVVAQFVSCSTPFFRSVAGWDAAI